MVDRPITAEKRGVDHDLMRRMNYWAVLSEIRRSQPISRVEITLRTKLGNATVGKIVNDLLTRGFIHEVGRKSSRVGRKRVLLEVRPDAGFIIGVDIGATFITGVLADLDASIRNRVRIPTPLREAPVTVVERVVEAITLLVHDSKLPQDKIMGVGVAAAGSVDRDKGLVKFSPDFGWSNIPLRSMLSEKVSLPVFVANTLRCMSFGELWFEPDKEKENFFFLSLGYGIGGAYVLSGEIYESGVGHMMILPDGPLCDCGNRGCLEALASGQAIARRAKEAIARGEETVLPSLVDGDIEQIEAKTVFQGARQGDRLCKEIIDQAVYYLGVGLANLVNIFNIDYFIAGGGMSLENDFLLEPLRRSVREKSLATKETSRDVRIVPSRFGAEATVMGALALVLREVFREVVVSPGE